MRIWAIFIIIAVISIFSSNPALAGEMEMVFSWDSLIIQNDFNFLYPGLMNINVNPALTLPVKTVYIPYGGNNAEEAVQARSIQSRVLINIPSELKAFDNALTGYDIYEAALPGHNSIDLEDIVYSVEKATIRGETFLAISILPVTIDSDNRVIFNDHVILDISDAYGQEVLKSDLVECLAESPDLAGRTRVNRASAVNGLPLATEMVIITVPELDSVFRILSIFKNASGITCDIAITDSIFANYPGIDNAEKIRNYLNDFYNNGGVYVLLGGDDITVPVRYVYYYNTSTYPEEAYLFMPSDLYYADMDGDWDSDGDGVWGEPSHDNPDLIPELKVGRLPVCTPEAAGNYIDKLIVYLTNPGNGDYSYLTRSLFFSADQMRDYPANGQHGVIAAEMPAHFSVDTTSAVEDPSGSDPNPTNPSGVDCVDLLGEGFGIVHIINHGRSDGFMVRSSGYGDWPASFVLTPPQGNGQGSLTELAQNGKVSFYYSLACKVGGYDLDSLDGESTDWSFVERMIAADSSGAVGMVANTRWGWVYSSYLLQQSFTRYLFGEANGSPVEAMYLSWLDYPFYRDLIYGQNYYGDPTLKIYTHEPGHLTYEINPITDDQFTINTSSTKNPVSDVSIILSSNGMVIEEGLTDDLGNLEFSTLIDQEEEYYVTAIKDGYTVAHGLFSPMTVLGANDDEYDDIMPATFELKQNYPNPFNPATTIAYTLPERSDVSLSVYNILGQKIWYEDSPGQNPGTHYIIWDGSSAQTGVYFYRLVTDDAEETKKMVLIK